MAAIGIILFSFVVSLALVVYAINRKPTKKTVLKKCSPEPDEFDSTVEGMLGVKPMTISRKYGNRRKK
jgi:hypothetical protein